MSELYLVKTTKDTIKTKRYYTENFKERTTSRRHMAKVFRKPENAGLIARNYEYGKVLRLVDGKEIEVDHNQQW